jgi:hypothetical protein
LKFAFVHLRTFVANWRALKLDDEALRSLELAIAQNPLAGPVMSGTGGLRKIHFAPPGSGRGKSGSHRVGYAYFVTHDQIVLVKAFGKNEKANLTPAERREVRLLLMAYERMLK